MFLLYKSHSYTCILANVGCKSKQLNTEMLYFCKTFMILVSNRNNSAKKCQIHINFLILLSFVKSKLMTKLKRSWKCSFLCKIFFPNINSFEKNIVIKRAQQFTKIVFSRFLQVKKVTAVGIFCNLRNFGATLCR